MFQHPSHTAQLAADLRLARRAEASRRRTRRAARPAVPTAGDPFDAARPAPAGFREAGVDVAAVVRVARRRRVGVSLAAIVADPAQPAVARERALGRLLAALATPDRAAASRAAPPAA